MSDKMIPTTVCRECVFAIANETEQTDCELGRLDKFLELGYEVGQLETVPAYYAIKGRICNTSVKKEAMAGIDPSRYKKTVEEFIKVRISVIVFADEFCTLEDIYLTLDSLLEDKDSDSFPPKQIIVWLDTKEIARSKVSQYFKDKKLNIQWCVNAIQDSDPLGFDDGVDEAFRNVKTTYFTALRAGEKLPQGFVRKVEKVVNEDLKDFLLIVDKHNNPLLYLSNLHKPLGGNFELPLAQKVQMLCEEKGLQNKVLVYEDL